MLWQMLSDLVHLRHVSRSCRIACITALGILTGLSLVVGWISRATSYLSDAPEACVNCHVMRPQYASWQHSSHFEVATCNDCHVPHQTLFHSYAFKARDGLYHSAVFTFRREPQVIRTSSAAIPVVEANCRRCHGELVESVALMEHQRGDNRCWDCHREVPHGQARSLSASPRVMNPKLPSVLLPQTPRIGGRKPRAE
jgi:cytochrome c nitrite reductase small subunit